VAKGIVNLYDDICNDLVGQKFIDWLKVPSGQFVEGMICKTVAWYVKSDRWYLEEHNYIPIDEPNSTWFARQYNGRYPAANSANVMKYFKLELDERLITTNGKERPVILLRKEKNDWWNPANQAKHEDTWLCLPIFTYKPRHNQEYVLNEEKLNSPNAFYVPSYYGSSAGIDSESSARFQSIQMVKEEHLVPLKRMCMTETPNMARPFGLSAIGEELVLYHFYKNMNILSELQDSEANYSLFKDEVAVRISASLGATP
jgi:hypothetical protein